MSEKMSEEMSTYHNIWKLFAKSKKIAKLACMQVFQRREKSGEVKQEARRMGRGRERTPAAALGFFSSLAASRGCVFLLAQNVIIYSLGASCVRELLRGNDVLAVLPTGFGKSRIFKAFRRVGFRLCQLKMCRRMRKLQDNNISPANILKFSRSKTIVLTVKCQGGTILYMIPHLSRLLILPLPFCSLKNCFDDVP